ncbi:hypothetical protein MMC34_004808 [Xylographa carneopallida]|nr:hypothetical protein [Xylographa carneopallida]
MLVANQSGGIAISPCESSPSTLFSCGLSNCATSNFTIDTNNVDIILRDSQIVALGLAYDSASVSGSPSSSAPTSAPALSSTTSPTTASPTTISSNTASTTSSSGAFAAVTSTTINSSVCASTSNADNALSALQDSDNARLNVVGIGVGVSLGLALMGALVLFGLEKLRNCRLAAKYSQVSLERETLQYRVRWYESRGKRHPGQRHELNEDRRFKELSAGIPAQEMSDTISHSGHRPAYRV